MCDDAFLVIGVNPARMVDRAATFRMELAAGENSVNGCARRARTVAVDKYVELRLGSGNPDGGDLLRSDGKDAVLGFVEQASLTCTEEIVSLTSEEDRVVMVFDFVVTEPVQFRIRMCEVYTIEEGKIRSADLYFDTAEFPSELIERLNLKRAA